MSKVTLHNSEDDRTIELPVLDISEFDESMWFDWSPTFRFVVTNLEEHEGQGDVSVYSDELKRFLAGHDARAEVWHTENYLDHLVIFDAAGEPSGAIELMVDGTVLWLEVLFELGY